MHDIKIISQSYKLSNVIGEVRYNVSILLYRMKKYVETVKGRGNSVTSLMSDTELTSHWLAILLPEASYSLLREIRH